MKRRGRLGAGLDLLEFLAAPTPRREGRGAFDRDLALREGVAWLWRSQDAGSTGVVRSFRMAGGWVPSPPAVTGEAVLALFDHANVAGDRSSFERGVRMAESLLADAQTADVGQVVRGLLRAGRECGDDRFVGPALPLARHLAEHSNGGDPTHGTIEALLDAWAVTGEGRFREAAAERVEAVLAGQRERGWFPVADEGDSRPRSGAFSGRLGALVSELVAFGTVTERSDVVDAARRCADPLVRRFEIDRVLWSRYDDRCGGSAPRASSEDHARVALSWLVLYSESSHPWYLNAALKLNDILCARQLLKARAPEVRGAVVDDRGWRGVGAAVELRSATTAAFCRSLLGERVAMPPKSVGEHDSIGQP